MKRKTVKWGIPLLVFVLTWMACKPIFSYLGTHLWFSAQRSLDNWSECIEMHEEMHGRIPEADLANRVITKLWISKGDLDYKSDGSDEDNLRMSMMYKSADCYALQVWGKPPKYIVSKDLPNGYGFYLEGEDEVTHSNGNDPDDINSWDRDSVRFYEERLMWKKRRRDFFISLGVGLFAFVLCRVRW